MANALERLWVDWLDSKRWRHFARHGLGAKVLHSQLYRRLDTARRFAVTRYKAHRHPNLFAEVQTFCLFVGQVKSGCTLLGALLDAHPDVVLADEIDALRYVAAGFKRDQIFHLLLKGARREALKGRVTARRLTPYSLAVPGQWQGGFQKLRVIGDSKAGPTTRRLSQRPELLGQMQQLMPGVDLRLIQVVRNPYDPISAMMMRSGRSFESAAAHYFEYCETLVDLRNQLPPDALLAVRYEDFVYEPQKWLADLCRFLGIEAHADYLESCAGIIKPEPDQYRHLVEWRPYWIKHVRDRMAEYDFLAGYTYEN